MGLVLNLVQVFFLQMLGCVHKFEFGPRVKKNRFSVFVSGLLGTEKKSLANKTRDNKSRFNKQNSSAHRSMTPRERKGH